MGLRAKIIERVASVFKPRVIVERRNSYVSYGTVREQLQSPTTNDVSLINPYLQLYGEQPRPVFSDQMKWISDPVINAACDFLAEAVAGVGNWVSCSETPQGRLAQKIIDEFNEAVNIDDLELFTAKNVVAFGNDFHKKISASDIVDLERIPLTSIYRIKRAELDDGTLHVVWYQQRLGGLYKLVDPTEIIHYRWNPENNAAFGVGLVTKLVSPISYNVIIAGQPVTRIRPSIMDIKLQLQDDFRLNQHRVVQRNIYHIPGGSSQDKAELENDLSAIEPDQDIVMRGAPEWKVQELGTGRRGTAVNPNEEGIINDIQLGLQTPILQLYATPGYTYASSQEATAMVQRKISALQKFLRRTIETQIYRPLLFQSGFTDDDIQVAKPIFNWGSNDLPEMDIATFEKLASDGFMTQDEVRRHLALNYKIDLEDTWTQAEAPAQSEPVTPPSVSPSELKLEQAVNSRILEIARRRKELKSTGARRFPPRKK